MRLLDCTSLSSKNLEFVKQVALDKEISSNECLHFAVNCCSTSHAKCLCDQLVQKTILMIDDFAFWSFVLFLVFFGVEMRCLARAMVFRGSCEHFVCGGLVCVNVFGFFCLIV